MKLSILALCLLGAQADFEYSLDDLAREYSEPRRPLRAPKKFHDELLNLPNSFIWDVMNLGKKLPPVRQNPATKVPIPSVDRLKYHVKPALLPYCLKDEEYEDAERSSVEYGDFSLDKIYRNMDYGSMVITGFVHDKKMIIVSHRGTANLRNWLRNISYGQVAMRGQPSNVRVHEGFLGIYRSTDNSSNRRLDELLADPKYKDYKVVFTGVSLGAATATIHAFDAGKRLKDQGRKVELFTYVGPRVGNRAFVDNFINLNITTGRYTNGGDLVSKMYPRTKGYVHIPGEFFSPPDSGDNVVTCSQAWDEDPNCGWSTNDNIRLIDHAFAFGELQKLCPYN